MSFANADTSDNRTGSVSMSFANADTSLVRPPTASMSFANADTSDPVRSRSVCTALTWPCNPDDNVCSSSIPSNALASCSAVAARSRRPDRSDTSDPVRSRS